LKKTNDGLIQFAWKDKSTGTVAEELLLFPDDAVFRKVDESNGRVYLLEFKSSNRKLFYWMQDKSDEKDKENCQLINNYISNPNFGSQKEGGGGGGGGGSINSQQLYNILNKTRQQQQGGTQSNTTGSSSPSTSSNEGTSGQTKTQNNKNVQLTHLQDLIERQSGKPKGPSLVEILDPTEIQKQGLFENQEVLDSLKEHLPEGNDSNPQTFLENVRSAQFQQALDIFAYALRHSRDMAGVLMSLGLDPNLAGPTFTVEEFLRALQEVANKKKMDI